MSNIDNKEPNGFIAVYKEQEWTSFDVVAKLRGILHTRKIGHGGTLDPMAEGVLPVFVGKAARACDILPDTRKRYTAGFRLGLCTDTEDIWGTVICESANKAAYQDIAAVLQGFVGDIMQVPPMYSAVKVNGRKLYRLAREGKEVAREPRPITVHSIEITSFDQETQQGTLDIDCEKGTYVRTIISDMGQLLGTGGVMSSLRRTYSGGCSIENCLKLADIEELVQKNGAQSVLTPVDRAFECYGRIDLDERLTKLYKNGVKLEGTQTGRRCDDKTYRVYGADGGFIGLGHFDLDSGKFRCLKNF